MIVSSRAATAHTVQTDLLAPSLTGGARVDVCIVGASLAGMTAAYMLARDRRVVMVIDDGPIGGAHAGDTAPLASIMDQPYAHLEALHGADAARVAAQGFVAAVDAIEAIVRRERIACDFERLDGYRFCDRTNVRDLEGEIAAAHRAGAAGVETLAAAPLDGAAPPACIRYPGQAQLHPVKYLAGLARAITREGGRIHCGVRTRALHPGQPSVLVTSAGHRIEADAIVIPGGGPQAASFEVSAATASPRLNVVALRVPRGNITRALYWEGEPLRCARLRNAGSGTGEVLQVAGEESHDVLEAWARLRFPRVAEILQRSSADIPTTSDLFAFVGETPVESQSLYVSAASWGSPMTRAAMAGLAIREFLAGARATSPERRAAANRDAPARRPARRGESAHAP
jgi:glycine/D-amino acid oxidase-like deaminating enzyme